MGSALKTEGSFGHTGNVGWLRRGLVVGQIALSLVLLTSAILFTRSLQNLRNIDVGFRTDNLLKFSVNPLQAGYSQQRIKSFSEEAGRRLTALPGVASAAVVKVPILEDSDEGGDITVEGAPVRNDGDESASAYLKNYVSPDFFSTMRIPLREGRSFVPSDLLPGSRVAIVNETFVKRFLARRNPIGVHFGFGTGNAVALTETIVGVVSDSQHSRIRAKIGPFVYLPLGSEQLSSLSFYVRLQPGKAVVSPSIRAVIHRMDADLPVNQISSMTKLIDESLFVERSLGYLSVGFAAIAILLAIVGLYGVMSYSVTSRSREFGIRMAIGATPRIMLTTVLREAGYLGIAGALCGLPLTLAALGYLRSSLYGVQPHNFILLGSAVSLLILVALLAGFVPARHASTIDPHTALRAE